MSITQKERKFSSATGLCDIVYRQWIPEEIRGAVVLVHGMSEHIARYDIFAKFLAENGFLVSGMDLPSHGKSWKEGLPRGFFGTEDGWGKVLLDIRALCAIVRRENPQVSVTLFGHSMGSLLSADYVSRYTNDFDAVVLCGTSGPNPAGVVGKFLANREIKAGRGMEPSPKLDKLCFGSFAKRVPHAKSSFDWLNRDEEGVKLYIEDSLCGFPFTPYGYVDLMTGISHVASSKWAAKVPNMPILLISGDKDPVGGMGKGVKKVNKYLVNSGHTHMTFKLYPGARHEILNGICRNEVYGDVLLFLEAVAAGGEQA